MGADVEIFEHEQFGRVRTVTIDGEPWFVGKDIAEALGYADKDWAIRAHVSAGQRQSRVIAAPEGAAVPRQKMTIISEGGVWRLVMRSNKEEAVRFQDWVAEDVVPAIRKTGRYVATHLTKSQALKQLGEEMLRHAETAEELERVRPRAELMELFDDKHGLDVGAVASLFGYRAHQFHEMMRTWGATYYNNNHQLEPSDYWVDRGWLSRRNTRTTVVTPEGLQHLENIIGRQVVGAPQIN